LLAPANATNTPRVDGSPAQAALSLLDDPRQWPLFGRQALAPGALSADAGLTWSSQVAILGMHCASCALNIEHALLAQPGVVSARVDAHSQRAEVVWRSDQSRPSQWMGAVAQAGYQALPAHDGDLLALGQLPVERGLLLSRDDLVRRTIIMALMCQGHVSFESIEMAHLIDFRKTFALELAELQLMQDSGLVTVDADAINVTEQGWYVVRAVAMVFDRYLRADQDRARFSKII